MHPPFDPWKRGAAQERRKQEKMITDVQLAIFANVLGVALFLFVVLYHYISVNQKKVD